MSDNWVGGLKLWLSILSWKVTSGGLETGRFPVAGIQNNSLWALGLLGVRVPSDTKGWGQGAVSRAAARPGLPGPAHAGSCGAGPPARTAEPSPPHGTPGSRREGRAPPGLPERRGRAGGPGNGDWERRRPGAAEPGGLPALREREGDRREGSLCRLADGPLGEERGILQCSGSLPFLATVGGPNQARLCRSGAECWTTSSQRGGEFSAPRTAVVYF